MNSIVKGIGFYSAVLGASSLLPLTRPSPSFVFVPSCCNVASLVKPVVVVAVVVVVVVVDPPLYCCCCCC